MLKAVIVVGVAVLFAISWNSTLRAQESDEDVFIQRTDEEEKQILQELDDLAPKSTMPATDGHTVFRNNTGGPRCYSLFYSSGQSNFCLKAGESEPRSIRGGDTFNCVPRNEAPPSRCARWYIYYGEETRCPC